MEVFYDSDGNIVDLEKIITILYTINLKADDGVHEHYVIRNHQYQFVTVENRVTNCDDLPLEYQGVRMDHYKLTIDTIDYYVPQVAAVIERTLRKAWMQDRRTFERKLSSQPKDVVKAYKECTGIDLQERAGRQHNGTEIYDKYKGEDMFDNDYGSFQKDDTTSGEYADLNNL